MILKTDTKEANIKLKMKDIVKLTETHGKNNLQEFFFESIRNLNLKNLATMILNFSYDEKDEKTFKTETEVYDFLDAYMEKEGKIINEIYKEMADTINNSGFFMKKMTEEELASEMKKQVDIDIDAIVSGMVKDVASEKMKPILEEEFKGYRA